MGTTEEKLDRLFENLSKDKKKDKSVETFRASDVRISSYIPYGILTRIPQLDLALGRPGYPVGRIMELYGLEFCGKTTAALMAIAQVQKMGGAALFIDTEFAFDADRAEELGVDVESLRIAEAETIEEVFRHINNTIKKLKEFGQAFMIVVDSVAAVPTEWESKKNENLRIDKPGEQAKAIKRGLKLIVSEVAKKNITLLLINHAHESMQGWGETTKSGGGHGIKFNSSARISFTKIKELREKLNPEDKDCKKYMRLGQEVKIDVKKSKISQLKFPVFNVDLTNEYGFNTNKSLLDALIDIGVITQSNPRANCKWGEIEFPKRDWEEVLAQNGGQKEVYKYFIKQACELGFMKPYSSQDLK